MQLRYDDDFLEGAVFTLANRRQHGPAPLQIRRFHRERELLYSILDPDERSTAFFDLHLEWFREWGLEKMLLGLTDETLKLRSALSALVFRKARIKNDEGAELYVQSRTGEMSVLPSRSAVIALRVERFDQPEELGRYLRHELTHIHDMVDPSFGYSPHLHLPGQNAAQQRITRERYRLLWDITIDGRLAGSSRGAPDSREQHRSAFERAFGFWPTHKREETFDSLWLNPNPTHGALMGIASDPRDLKSAQKPLPGAACPLCGFSTFDWAGMGFLAARTISAIQREFLHWTPDQGACARCVEIYRLAGTQSLATV